MFKRIAAILIAGILSSVPQAQTLINQGSYTSTSLVDTNSTSNSTSSVTTDNRVVQLLITM
jgi:hypothetical protein